MRGLTLPETGSLSRILSLLTRTVYCVKEATKRFPRSKKVAKKHSQCWEENQAFAGMKRVAPPKSCASLVRICPTD